MNFRLVVLIALAGAVVAEPLQLANGWLVRPAGRQIETGGFPMAAVLSPDRKYLVALDAGLQQPSLVVLETTEWRVASRTPIPDGWLGLTFNARGDRLYVGGGAQAAVFEFTFQDGKLAPARSFSVVDPAKRTSRDFVGDVALSPDGRLIYAAELFQNSIAVINPQSGMVIDRFKTGRRPYRILFHPDGKTFFVSCWADGMVLQHETENGAIRAKFLLAPHPTDMAWAPGAPQPALEEETSPYVARIFVAAANTNSIRVLGVTASGEVRVSEAINLALTPYQPAGMTPAALAYEPASKRIYVACADENAVAVLDVTEAQSRLLGYLPAGRYPTAVAALPGDRLIVVNGGGSVSMVDLGPAERLETYSRIVRENSPYRDEKIEEADVPTDSPVPAWPGGPTPIRHVFYLIIDEGVRYDQVFGGQAAPALRRLASEHGRLENFRALGETQADGYNWAVAGISPDFVEKLRRAAQAGRLPRKDFDETEPAAIPPAGYLWTNARAAGTTTAVYTARRPAVEQAAALLRDLALWEKGGAMPRLTVMRLAGTLSEVDKAVGAIAGALARSRFWPDCAIFITATHAGGVSDDRVPALVVSPWVRPGAADTAAYSTVSMLRTVELLSGLRPMTQFDAAATPITGVFRSVPAKQTPAAEATSN